MLALETLSANGKELIPKGKKYVVGKEDCGYSTKYFVIDNYGDRLYLTKEELLYKFKLSNKEDL